MGGILSFIVVLPFLLPAWEIRLRVPGGPSLRTSGEDARIVRGFLRLPAEGVPSTFAFRLLDGSGRPCTAMFHLYPGGEGRGADYLGFTALNPGGRLSGTWRLRAARGIGRQGGARGEAGGAVCRSRRDGESVLVDTGPLQARFSPRSPGLVESMRVGKTLLFCPERSWSLEVAGGGKRYTSLPPRTVHLFPGAVETRVILAGCTRSERDGAGPSFVLELRFHGGIARVEGRIVVTAGPEALSGAGAVLRIHPLFDRGCARLLFQGDRPRSSLYLAGDLEAGLDTDGAAVTVVRGKRRVLLGVDRSAGLRLSCRGKGCWVWLPSFRPLHPWSLRFSPPGEVRLCLFSSNFHWEAGIPLCRTFRVEPFTGNGGPAPAGEDFPFLLSKAPALRSPPFLDLARYDTKDPLHGLYMETTARLQALLDAEAQTWNGYRDWGDYRTAAGEYANGEYDPAYGLLKRWLLSGTPRDLDRARAVLEHHLCFDLTGTVDAPLPPGLPFGHGADHRSGWIEAGHMWVDGTLLAWLLLGEERYHAAALRVGEYLAARIPEKGEQEKERCAAWALVALAALVERGCTSCREPMDRLAAQIRSSQGGAGCFLFETARVEERTLYKSNTWVTAGITLEGLYRHYRLTGDPRSAAALLRGAEWLVTAGMDPKDGGWSCVLFYRSGAGGEAPVLRRGHVRGENRAFLALGLARAAEVSGDAGLAATARGLLQEGLEELSAHPPSPCGRALSVILRCAPDVIASSAAARGAGG